MSKRRKSRTFIALPHDVVNHHDYLNLSGNAVKLLIDIANQYNGHNNGDFCVAFSIMEKRGWKSKSNLSNAKKELLKKNMIKLTRQGGRNKPSLYAIVWQPIDDCKGKLDIKSTILAPRSFK